MIKTSDFDDGFSCAICYALAIMNSHGDVGSSAYEEALNGGGKDRVIAYARKNRDMRFTGLDRYLRMTKP
jgi:hypothetical protein